MKQQIITTLLVVLYAFNISAQAIDSTITDTAITTTYSAMDVENINRLRLESPVHTLDLSDLTPRQKMRLVKQLQRIEGKNQRYFLKVVTKTIIRESDNAKQLTIALGKLHTKAIQDSLRFAFKTHLVEKRAEIREKRIEERNETARFAIEKQVASLKKYLMMCLSVIAGLVLWNFRKLIFKIL